IHKACITGVKELYDNGNVSLVATADQSADNDKNEAQPVAFSINAESFMADKALHEEVFGPVTLFVLCKDVAQIEAVLDSLHGQLTATIHAEKEDEKNLNGIVK